MIGLYGGSRLVDLIFCVTTLLKWLQLLYRRQISARDRRLSTRIHEEINWGHEKANADYERLFMHQGTNKSKQPRIRT